MPRYHHNDRSWCEIENRFMKFSGRPYVLCKAYYLQKSIITSLLKFTARVDLRKAVFHEPMICTRVPFYLATRVDFRPYRLKLIVGVFHMLRIDLCGGCEILTFLFHVSYPNRKQL